MRQPVPPIDSTCQLNDGESPRTQWQTAYRGNGQDWTLTPISFTTLTGYRWESGDEGGVNNNDNNRGWAANIYLPFSAFGLSGPPAEGTHWRFAIAVHDRDDASGTPIADKLWPEGMSSLQEATWGDLVFGLPVYVPPPSTPSGSTSIRHRLDGAVVTDGMVGGGSVCGNGLDYWTQWGETNYAGSMFFNVQNQGDIADWPCFSKYYATFPLTAVPPDKVIISATLTLHQFGNPGGGSWGEPTPSYLQVLTIDRDWSEGALTWNTAPLALENVSGEWVDPLPEYGGDPGVPRTWNISRATAEAYQSGGPLRLAIYSADWDYQSGRYFWSSDHDDWHPEARPTLTVVWGEPAAKINHAVSPAVTSGGEIVTYALSLLGSGNPLTLTSDLPAQVSAPRTIQVNGGGVANYNGNTHRVEWVGTPGAGHSVTLTFPVTVMSDGPRVLDSVAVLTNSIGITTSATASFLVDPYQVWLPIAQR